MSRSPRDSEADDDGLLARTSRALAILGGLLLLGVTAMTVISIAGRYLFDAPIPGDYEITELACGVAVFAFLPYCHLRRGNIVIEFFTSGLTGRTRTWLDAFHGVAFAAVAVVITWRLTVGGVDKMNDGEHTLFLEIPLHWGYFPAVVGGALLVVVCTAMAIRDVGNARR